MLLQQEETSCLLLQEELGVLSNDDDDDDSNDYYSPRMLGIWLLAFRPMIHPLASTTRADVVVHDGDVVFLNL